MNKNLLILGAGQYGTVVKEIAKTMGCFEKIDFLDDSFGMGATEGNYHEKSIGKLSAFENFITDYSYAIVAIGNPEIRKMWTEKLIETCYKIPIIVSPKAFVGNTAQLRYGVVIEPMAVVHENVAIGIGTYISAGVVVNHNSFVADYCHIDNNAVVMRGALVKNFSTVKPCSVIYPAEIAERSPIGDGYNFDDIM